MFWKIKEHLDICMYELAVLCPPWRFHALVVVNLALVP